MGGEFLCKLGVVAAVGDGDAFVEVFRWTTADDSEADGEEGDVGKENPEGGVREVDLLFEEHDGGGDEDGGEGDGDHAAPGEVHELIETEAGEGPADPHVKEEEDDDFAPEYDELDEDVDPVADGGLTVT